MTVRKQGAADAATIGRPENLDFSFLPTALVTQCCSLIESYHDVHGFGSLPDILWRSGLGPFIERHRQLQQFLRRASMTRSAKKAHEGFARIATTILSMEILASSFAGWGAIYPEAAELARDILKANGGGRHMPLMEFYLYPPKYISSAAIATLAPPADRRAWDSDIQRLSSSKLAEEKQALDYIAAIRSAKDGRRKPSVAAAG